MPDPITEIAWGGFIRWAFKQKELVDAFEKDTGLKIKDRNILEQMIDAQTGAEDELFFEFMRYVTEKHWGMEYAPESFQQECARRDEIKEQNRLLAQCETAADVMVP